MSTGQDREHWEGFLATSGGWAVVADGMGGHEAGELASRSVVETVHRLAHRLESEVGIGSILNEANVQIFAQIASGAGRPGMGTTIVGIAFTRRQCFAFNIGDSRLYVQRGAKLIQLSIDDTMRTGDRSGTIRNHALTQSLGGTRDPVPLFPHIREWSVHPKDLVVLSSDGLSDMLSEEQILALLEDEPMHPALALVNAAVKAGGRDNATAIVIGPEL